MEQGGAADDKEEPHHRDGQPIGAEHRRQGGAKADVHQQKHCRAEQPLQHRRGTHSLGSLLHLLAHSAEVGKAVVS